MDEPAGPPALRIGTEERNAALAALDAHLEAGRLDAMEYGERSAHVAEARTVDEITPLFADLPAPHPRLPGVTGPAGPAGSGADPVPAADVTSTAPAKRPGTALETWGPRVAAVMPFLAVALFFLVPGGHSWVFFLLIPIAGALFARSHDDHRAEHEQRREERRARRDERRGRR